MFKLLDMEFSVFIKIHISLFDENALFAASETNTYHEEGVRWNIEL